MSPERVANTRKKIVRTIHGRFQETIPRSNGAVWMGSALCAALGVAAFLLLLFGTEERGIDAGLAAVARLSRMDEFATEDRLGILAGNQA